ncbi:MAG TPA: helix-turn-helix domain-containing protein [Pseudonocardiaceae bacterium]|jgi:AcrR family transcriptional regulator|nr:helix-turn-helix domain-containing protein [Pseudonocardiaceae bacterium]
MTRATADAEPRLSLRAQHKELTRSRVLDAAVATFDQKSFVDTTMEDIARAAGVTRVTVYAHFAGKTEILRALLTSVYGLTDRAYDELAALPRWDRTGIRRWLDEAATRWREMAPTIRVLTSAGATLVHDASRPRDLYRSSHERYVALLADPARWPHTDQAQAEQRSLLAILQIESFLSLWLAGAWPVDTDDPLDLLTDAICHLLEPALD